MLDLFNGICHFNSLIGNKRGDEEKVPNQLQLIVEELHEVQDAHREVMYDKPDGIIHLRGEICDLIVVCIGMAYILDIAPQELDLAFENEAFMKTSGREIFENFHAGKHNEFLSYFIKYAMYLADTYNLPLENDLRAINVSNMSKFCENIEEVEAAERHFSALNIEVEQTCHNPKYMGFISTMDQKDINGKYYSKGKLLKPPHWVAAEIV